MPRLLAAALAFACTIATAAPPAPVADHHQHLFSPAVVALLASPQIPGLAAHDLIALLDTAGIHRATVLSTAYMFGRPDRAIADEYAKVRAENDWTAAQAAQYPDRLVAFCAVNPLRDYALAEIARCAAQPGLRKGLKLHFGNSDVQLDIPAHADKLRAVFAEANRHGMAIAVHMRASISKRRPYGATQARILLEQVLPAAPDIPVQIAHLAGTGPGYDDPWAIEAMGVLADAAARKDPRARNLWFEISTRANPAISETHGRHMAEVLRKVGMDRVLYGSDSAVADNLRPREAWAAFTKLPLTEEEFAQIAANVAPYLR
jgi:predicted TIM-barrel fold metal-dependent hydrolase